MQYRWNNWGYSYLEYNVEPFIKSFLRTSIFWQEVEHSMFFFVLNNIIIELVRFQDYLRQIISSKWVPSSILKPRQQLSYIYCTYLVSYATMSRHMAATAVMTIIWCPHYSAAIYMLSALPCMLWLPNALRPTNVRVQYTLLSPTCVGYNHGLQGRIIFPNHQRMC